MARAERRRDARAKQPAGPTRYESAYVGTEGLFFQRLRSRAKWVFLALAIVFASTFVLFGVGSNVQGGVADIFGLGGGGGSGQPSIDDAREKLAKNPDDAVALRELATALTNDGRPQEAIVPLQKLSSLHPRDEALLRELAGLYLTKANRQRDQLQTAQAQAFLLNPGSTFLPTADTVLGQALASPPITTAVTSRVNERINTLYSEVAGSFGQAQQAYQQLARLLPDDAAVQLDLATASQNAGDIDTAIAAYKRFLKLAPEDPNAPLVRQEIKRLQASAALSQSASAG